MTSITSTCLDGKMGRYLRRAADPLALPRLIGRFVSCVGDGEIHVYKKTGSQNTRRYKDYGRGIRKSSEGDIALK